jgi:hypothetical protein
MTEIQLFALLAKLRKAQQKYFETRDSAMLSESKRLEKMLDAEIGRRLAWYTPQALKVAWQALNTGNGNQMKLEL